VIGDAFSQDYFKLIANAGLKLGYDIFKKSDQVTIQAAVLWRSSATKSGMEQGIPMV
jgi:hypothetical protein